MRVVILCCLMLLAPAVITAQVSDAPATAPSPATVEAQAQANVSSACSQRCSRVYNAAVNNCGADSDPTTCQSRAAAKLTICNTQCP